MQGGNLLAFDASGNLVVGGSSGPPTLPPAKPIRLLRPPAIHPRNAFQRKHRTKRRICSEFPRAGWKHGRNPASERHQADAYAMAWSRTAASCWRPHRIPGCSTVARRCVQRSGSAADRFRRVPRRIRSLAAGRCPQLGCVTDSVTLAPIGPAAPGQLLSLFGAGLGPQTGYRVRRRPDFPARVAGQRSGDVRRPAGAAAVRLVGQINVQVPFEVAQSASTVMTVSIGPDSVTRMFAVARSNPSVFLDKWSAPAAACDRIGGFAFVAVALNSDGSRNSCTNPAKPSTSVTIFLNGVAAKLGSSFAATGSITGPNPDPFGSQVDVREARCRGAAGPLFPAPGMIAGISQLSVQLPEISYPGLWVVSLEVAIDGILAFPCRCCPTARYTRRRWRFG